MEKARRGEMGKGLQTWQREIHQGEAEIGRERHKQTHSQVIRRRGIEEGRQVVQTKRETQTHEKRRRGIEREGKYRNKQKEKKGLEMERQGSREKAKSEPWRREQLIERAKAERDTERQRQRHESVAWEPELSAPPQRVRALSLPLCPRSTHLHPPGAERLRFFGRYFSLSESRGTTRDALISQMKDTSLVSSTSATLQLDDL